MVTRLDLMPGVCLSAIRTKKFKTSYWSALLLTPLQRKTASMTALLPRVLYCGTQRYPQRWQLAAALEDLYGGAVSPVTAKLGEVQATGFQASFLDDPYALDREDVSGAAVALLGDLLLRPATRNARLRGECVALERDNLVSELHSQNNDKMRYAARRLNEEMCRREPFAVDRLGSVKQAETIGPVALHRHYRRVLETGRLELYYCGSLDPDRVARLWTEALMGLPRSGAFPLGETAWRRHPKAERRVREVQPVSQAKLALGLRTNCRLDQPDYPALRVANAILGGSPSSKLFCNVRERRSLCYYAMSTIDPHKGLMGIHVGIAPEQAQAAEAAVREELAALQAGNFDSRDLEAAKAHLCNQLRSGLDTHAGLYGFYTDQSQSALPVTPEEHLVQLASVTAQQVTQAAQALALDTVYLLTDREEGSDETV